MKNKLDLNSLLAKYQDVSAASSSYYNPPPQEYNEPALEQQFYQTKPSPKHKNQLDANGNFQMSKSECEKYLLKVRDQLKNQTKTMSYTAQMAIKQIHQNFQRQHQKIKRQVLQLLDKAFIQNQRRIRQQLTNIGKIQPPQFSTIYRKVQLTNQTIDKLLHQLRGSDYRRAIAEVVLKDFISELNDIRIQIKNARNNYINYLGEVEHDHQRVNCIREDLNHLFKISKKNANLVLKIFENSKEKSSRQVPISYQEESQPPPRNRKSFFNFGND